VGDVAYPVRHNSDDSRGASTMVIGLSDTACTSQSETRVTDVTVNLGLRAKGGSHTLVTGATTINV
jgi:hypothetical protein